MKCLKCTNKNNVKTKCKIDGKANLHSLCIECGFKKLETIDTEELEKI